MLELAWIVIFTKFTQLFVDLMVYIPHIQKFFANRIEKFSYRNSFTMSAVQGSFALSDFGVRKMQNVQFEHKTTETRSVQNRKRLHCLLKASNCTQTLSNPDTTTCA